MKYKKIGKRIWQGPPATKKFDMNQEPKGQKWYFVWIIWIGTTLRKWLHRVKVEKVNMEGDKILENVLDFIYYGILDRKIINVTRRFR